MFLNRIIINNFKEFKNFKQILDMNKQDYIVLTIRIVILILGLILMILNNQKASSISFTLSFLLLAYWNSSRKKRVK